MVLMHLYAFGGAHLKTKQGFFRFAEFHKRIVSLDA
jgi:hypothetical protein